jgi:hypothetical protein
LQVNKTWKGKPCHPKNNPTREVFSVPKEVYVHVVNREHKPFKKPSKKNNLPSGEQGRELGEVLDGRE